MANDKGGNHGELCNNLADAIDNNDNAGYRAIYDNGVGQFNSTGENIPSSLAVVILLASIGGIQLSYKSAQVESTMATSDAQALDKLEQLSSFIAWLSKFYAQGSSKKNQDNSTSGADIAWSEDDKKYFAEAGFSIVDLPSTDDPGYAQAKAKFDLEQQAMMETINDPEFTQYQGKDMGDEVALAIFSKHLKSLNSNGVLSADDISDLTSRFTSIIDKNKTRTSSWFGSDVH